MKNVKQNSSPKASLQTGAPAEAGFHYPRWQLQELVNDALQYAQQLGATAAGADASEGAGMSVSVRLGQLETIERNRDKSIGVTVYIGQQRGNASTSDFSKAALQRTVQAAYDIARFTASDDTAGLPDPDMLVTPQEAARDLQLFHPWAVTPEAAQDLALRAESAALAVDKRITNSEGAAVSAQQSQFYSAHRRFAGDAAGASFGGGYASSRHSLSVSPIAGKGDDMQRDYWYTSERSGDKLLPPEAVGRYAAERALSRLNAKRLSTRSCPVLFEAPLAAGLLGSLVQALSGGALYRQTSFLQDSMSKAVLPAHISVAEDPFVLGGNGSCAFDDEGVRVASRWVIDQGRVAGYFLSTYSARKLGLKSTGNAGGSHNLALVSAWTKPQDDLPAMLRKLGTGLFVTELMGSGVNLVTGDYSRGASGYWVEKGVIAYPVQEITIAGNLRDMWMGIEAIGADAFTYGSKTVGSVLIGKMKVAGS